MPQVRALNLDDLPALAAFLAAWPGEKRDQEFWRQRLDFWWPGNPAFSGAEPLGWCLEEAGEMVGFVGSIPSDLVLDGRPIKVLNATTWRVLEPFREHSLRLWFALLGAGKGSVIFCTTPNEVALEILQGLKFRPTPPPHAQSNVNLDFQVPVRLRLGDHPLSGLVAWGLGLAQRRRVRARALPPGLTVEPLERAGEEFDQLWQRTSRLHATTNLRSAAWVQWYCFGMPALPKVLLACRAGGRLQGYAILRAVGKGGDRGLELLDLWVDPSQPRVVEALFTGAAHYALERKYHVLALHHFSPFLARELAAWGLGRLKEQERRHFWRARGAAAQAMEQDAYLVYLQGDVGL